MLIFNVFLLSHNPLCHIHSWFFYQDVASEIVAELQGVPDFVIGNYSDGNLVASLLAYKMGVTQVSNDFWYSNNANGAPILSAENAILVISFDMCSVRLHMRWRKQNIQIQISIGKTLTRSTISHVNSRLI